MKKLIILSFSFFILTSLVHSQEIESAVKEEVIYGRKHGMALTMVVLNPIKANGKGIISVVSGNWISNYNSLKRWFVQSAKPFIDDGYTVFLTMHGSNPRYDIAEAVSDIKRAVQYVRYNAEKLGIDPENIGITGASSGGHLSLTVATSDDIMNPEAEDPVERVSSKVQAAAVFYPPTDFLNWGQPDAYMNYLEHGDLLAQSRVLGALRFNEFKESKFVYDAVDNPEKLKDIAMSISPSHLVTTDDAPVLIIHGDSDSTVPVQQAELLKEKFDSINLPLELTIKPGANHGWNNMNEDRLEFVKWFKKHLSGD